MYLKITIGFRETFLSFKYFALKFEAELHFVCSLTCYDIERIIFQILSIMISCYLDKPVVGFVSGITYKIPTCWLVLSQ